MARVRVREGGGGGGGRCATPTRSVEAFEANYK